MADGNGTKANMVPLPSDEAPEDKAIRLISGRQYAVNVMGKDADENEIIVHEAGSRAPGRLQNADKALVGISRYFAALPSTDQDFVLNWLVGRTNELIALRDGKKAAADVQLPSASA